MSEKREDTFIEMSCHLYETIYRIYMIITFFARIYYMTIHNARCMLFVTWDDTCLNCHNKNTTQTSLFVVLDNHFSCGNNQIDHIVYVVCIAEYKSP